MKVQMILLTENEYLELKSEEKTKLLDLILNMQLLCPKQNNSHLMLYAAFVFDLNCY